MNIDYTVTALMFPAIPLMMAVYSNRFHSLSILVRNTFASNSLSKISLTMHPADRIKTDPKKNKIK